jgi:hypothetical protein
LEGCGAAFPVLLPDRIKDAVEMMLDAIRVSGTLDNDVDDGNDGYR